MGLFDELDAVSAEGKNADSIIKAPFTWPAGKWRSVDYILSNLPYGESYVEPYGGTGIIGLLRHKSPLEVFNDTHNGVAAFYRCMRDPRKFVALVEKLELTVHSKAEFLECKKTWPYTEDEVERAFRWYYSVVYSFSSLGRNWGRAVTSSARIAGRIRDKLPYFQPVHERVREWQIENCKALDLIDTYDNIHSVWYFDPPYNEGDPYVFGKDNMMTEEDHRILLGRISKMKGFVAISGRPNNLYDSQRFWDDRKQWEVAGSMEVQAFTEGNNRNLGDAKRTKKQEVLWIKGTRG